MRARRLLLTIHFLAGLVPAVGLAQIQRCEGVGGAIVYSNEECPAGTKPVRSLQAAPQPTPEQQQAARAQVQKNQAASQQLAQQRQVQQSQQATQEAERRATDCAYLRAEIDSVRRMRNILTTRPYYSLDDVDQMDKHGQRLVDEHRRTCG